MSDTSKKQPNSSEDLFTPVQFLKGVGPHRAELLGKLGLHTVADILFFFPRDYQDYSQLVEISDLQEDVAASVIGKVIDLESWRTRNGTTVFAALIENNEHTVRGIW
ncbi:MAG: ATP-dependent DNA helicase RecG, partial [Pirellulaceae bacterium]|nr:ATP-dependent DNA helicase RecG [Pirellulaceae bacterium]